MYTRGAGNRASAMQKIRSRRSPSTTAKRRSGAPPAARDGTPALFRTLKAYVGFDGRDSRLLAAFYRHVEPHLDAIVDDFYDRIEADPGAARVITGGPEQIGRLKQTLRQWLVRALRGPHDLEFAILQSRIGRRHVGVALDQSYMVTGMNVFREHLNRILFQAFPRRSPRSIATQRAFVKVMDIVLALMLETYREDLLRKILRAEQNATVRRLAALGEVAASIAHEIRNPLAGINGAIQILGQEIAPEDSRQAVLREIQGEIRRLDERVNDLLLYARPSTPRREPVRPRELLETTVRALAEDPMFRDVHVSIRASGGLPAFSLDPGQIRQVLVNLVLNAVQAMGGAGRIELVARLATGGALELVVEDSGPGVPAHLAEEIFRPFFTTRPHGTGLGLAISRKIAESHGGSLTAGRGKAGGARFVLSLPVPEDAPPFHAPVG